jgi:hypothetical protein
MDSKYHRWYDAIVAQGDDVSDYVEKHHILPRCMGGGNNPSNLIRVTARKHFLLHWLLTKFTEGEALRKMRYGLRAMCTQHGEKRIFAAWQYEVAKRASRRIRLTEEEKADVSRKTREAMARPEVKGKMGGPQSKEHIAKLTAIRTGKKQSAETVEKRTAQLRGKIHPPRSPESLERIRLANQGKNIGRVVSQETRDKISATEKATKETIECPHCGMLGQRGLMNRWHFDHCSLEWIPWYPLPN